VAHLDPEILLIDEVLGVGDIRFQQKCLEKMMTFQEGGVTMVLVTHSIASVAKICDRVMWIEDRMVKMIGDPTEIAQSYCKASGVEMDIEGPATPAPFKGDHAKGLKLITTKL
jgi:lipopolysaccharide transport system ATP-binding protein